jgi:hypothetical protein
MFDSPWLILALLLLGCFLLFFLLGMGLHAWIKVLEYWKGKSFDLSQFVTQAQLAAMKSDRDLQIKTTFELLTIKIDHVSKTMDNLDKDLRQVRGDMPSLHHAIGEVEGRNAAEERIKRPR